MVCRFIGDPQGAVRLMRGCIQVAGIRVDGSSFHLLPWPVTAANKTKADRTLVLDSSPAWRASPCLIPCNPVSGDLLTMEALRSPEIIPSYTMVMSNYTRAGGLETPISLMWSLCGRLF